MLRLLDPDPSKRMTAEQAQQHSFLTTKFLDITPDALPPKVREDPGAPKTTEERALWEFCANMCQTTGADEDVHVVPLLGMKFPYRHCCIRHRTRL